jgi:hypothetical protein
MKFHLAFPVTSLDRTKAFYQEVIGCTLGRESEQWVDFDFFEHQITAHLCPGWSGRVHTNEVDGKSIPIPHFGLILTYEAFDELAGRLKSKNLPFIIEPYLRFAGEAGEQKTMFIQDPSGNGLEFKAFKSSAAVFAK